MEKLDFIWREAEGLPRKQTTREVLQCAHCAHPDLYSEISFDNPHYDSVRITCDLCGSNICASAKDVSIEELIDDCVKRWNRRDPEYVEPELVLWFYSAEMDSYPKFGSFKDTFFLNEHWEDVQDEEKPDVIKITIKKSQLKRLEELTETVREKGIFKAEIIGENLFFTEAFQIKEESLIAMDEKMYLDYVKTSVGEIFVDGILNFEQCLEISIPIGGINNLKELFRCQK